MKLLNCMLTMKIGSGNLGELSVLRIQLITTVLHPTFHPYVSKPLHIPSFSSGVLSGEIVSCFKRITLFSML